MPASIAQALLLVYVFKVLSNYYLITVVLSHFFLGEALTLHKVVATACGVAGILIAMEFWTIADLFILRFSDSLALLNGLFSALILIIGRKSSHLQDMTPLVSLQYSFFFAFLWIALGTLVLAIVFPAAVGAIWALSFKWQTLVFLLATGLLGTGIAYTLLYSGLRGTEASLSGLLMLLEPVTVFILQALFLNIPIDFWQIFGGTILLLSGYWAGSWSPRSKKVVIAATPLFLEEE